MKVYDGDHIKNIVLIGHAGTGKTTLTEAMLYEAGVINRRGTVENKNTVSDYLEIEQERGNSIASSLISFDWRGYKINLIDSPGYDEFIGEVIAALKVSDTALMLLNAQHGVEVGTIIDWEWTEKFNTPVIFAVNQLDHEMADFDNTIRQARERFGKKVTIIQYPLNPGNGFNAIIDVLKMVMYKFGPEGGKPEKLPIPPEEKEKAEQLHNELVEAAAENDESLMELYFEKGELDEDEMRKGLRIGLRNREFFPVFCLCAKNNMGSGRLMGFINNVAPSPVEREARLKDGSTLPIDPNAQPVAFVYKTVSEANLGEMSFFKVYSGKLTTGIDLVNEDTGATERFNQLFVIQGKKRISVDALVAGDLGATVKLKNTHTNNTLHAKGFNVAIEPIEFPEPRITVAVIPKTKGEEEKLAMALQQLHEEDPTLVYEHSLELKQILLHGQGEMHLQMAKWKLEHLKGVKCEFIKPKVPYRETIQKSVEVSYRHKKQTGGAGQFAEVHFRVEPYYEGMPLPQDLTVRSEEVIDLDWGGKLVFLNCIVGGAIDTRFMGAIVKGLMEKMQEGPLTGSYARDIRVSVFDGKMHPVDSNDMAFKTASLMAFKKAFLEASPQLLEPIYEVEVLCPEDIMGDIMSDLQTRRAIIMGMEAEGPYQKIKAKVPLSELYKYASTLRSISQGRAKHTQRFVEYAPVPPDIQQKLIAEYQAELQEA